MRSCGRERKTGAPHGYIWQVKVIEVQAGSNVQAARGGALMPFPVFVLKTYRGLSAPGRAHDGKHAGGLNVSVDPFEEVFRIALGILCCDSQRTICDIGTLQHEETSWNTA